MTNPTATKTLISRLEAIDKQFLPITHKPKEKPEDHIKELLSLFEKELGEDGNGILAVNPIFYEITNWADWLYDVIKQFNTISWADKKTLYSNYLVSSLISYKTEHGFTNTLLKWINHDREARGNVVINIKIASLDESDIIKEIASVNNNDSSVIIYRFIVDKDKLMEQKRLYHDNIKYEKVKPYHCDLNKVTPSDVDLKEYVLEATYDNNPLILPEYSGLLEKIKYPVFHHAMYLDERHELCYCFSSPVKSDKNDKGLGGLFVLFENDVINADDVKKMIDALCRISDTLAVRTIYYS